MDERLKQRLVGAAVLVSLAVIVVPMILETPSAPDPVASAPRVPPKPKGDFSSKIVPLEAPETPMLDAARSRREAAAPDVDPAPADATPVAPAVTEAPVADAAARAMSAAAAPASPANPPEADPPEADPPGADPPGADPPGADPSEADSPEPARAASGAPDRGPTAWAVQLGSFSNTRNAVGLRDDLRAKGYRAFVETARSTRGEVTRVFVGPELGRTEAVETVNKLYAETKLKGIVVRYPGS